MANTTFRRCFLPWICVVIWIYFVHFSSWRVRNFIWGDPTSILLYNCPGASSLYNSLTHWGQMRHVCFTACVIHMTTLRTRLLHCHTNYNEPHNVFTHGHFVARNSTVRTRPQNPAWGNCGETSAYNTTQRPLLYPWLNEWDVLMWSIRLCNGLEEAIPYKVTWLHRLRQYTRSSVVCGRVNSDV